MKAKTIVVLGCDPSPEFPAGVWPIGHIVDHPDAYKLVRRGCAVWVDDECEQAADMTQHQLDRAQKAYPKVAAGIHPDDYEAYDAGLMSGYYADGSWVPGPNADETEDGGIILP